MNRSVYDSLVSELDRRVRRFYGDRLVTLALYGSYARNEMRSDSDLDILIIAEGLPRGRMRRVAEFLAIERELSPFLEALAGANLHPSLSPIFKTPKEAERGSPLFLDMTQEIELLLDRDGFFLRVLDRLRNRLKELGAQRIWEGKMWYWVLKPDIEPGEIITL